MKGKLPWGEREEEIKDRGERGREGAREGKGGRGEGSWGDLYT